MLFRSYSPHRRCCAYVVRAVTLVVALGVTPIARAQTVSIWKGLASPDNNWTALGNWDTNIVPVSGDFAQFDGAGNGNTTISLGGTTQPIKDVLITTASAAAYTLGQSAGDALSFDANGSLWVNPGVATAQTINATILTNGGLLDVHNGVNNGVSGAPGDGLVGLTFGPINMTGGTFRVDNGVGAVANTTTKFNGIISDTIGQPGILHLKATSAGAANNTNFVINGNNTYTGGTIIEANTGTNGAIYVGTDTAFGTGKITTMSSLNNAEIRALGGTRTIANGIDLNQGLNFAGTNNIVLSGPIAIASGAVSRTISNKISGTGTLTFGASPGSSNIYLGNPVSIGGDGVGRTIILSATANTTMIVNAVFQDVDAGGANSSVNYGGNAGGNIIINALQTYTSPTRLGGGSSTVQFHHDYNAGDPSGPFGLGTLIANNGANTQIAPTGGDRTIANPFRLDFGFTVVNIPSDSSGVTFSGPITFTSNDNRLIQNLMNGTTGGTLTLGSAASPSTLSLDATVADKTLTFSGSGKTIINDTIQDASANLTHIGVTNSSTTTFNGPQPTNGNFSVTGANSTVIINGNRSGTGTMTVNGTNAKLLVNGSKSGSGAVTVTAGTLGGNGSIAGDVTNNGKIAPGTSIGTLTLTNNLTMGANSHLVIELSDTSADKLVVGGNLDLSAAEFLDVTGLGIGPSWLIATYAGTLTGVFDSVTTGYTVDYGTSNQIILKLAGDYNGDGIVDAADYTMWRKNPDAFGGDPGGYDTWRANFGHPPVSGAGSGLRGGSVPEPASFLLAGLGLLMACMLRCRQIKVTSPL